MEFLGGIFVGYLFCEMFANKISMDSYNDLDTKFKYLKTDMKNLSENLKKFVVKLPTEDSKLIEEIIFEMNRLSK